MRLALLIAALVMAVAGLWLWAGGGMDRLTLWAAGAQREFQTGMAGALRRLRAGDTAAWVSLMSLCFAYGFVHAVGPGHGKLLIGGYGVGRSVAMMRLAGIALLSSLAQGLTAILLVLGGVWVLNLGRRNLVGATEAVFAPLSYAAIGLVGLWLMWRGLRKLPVLRRSHGHAQPQTQTPPQAHAADHGRDHAHDHAHDHGPGELCDHCGHRHGPTAEEAAAVSGLRDLLVLVGAIAVRPCTGALFLLLICWSFGIMGAGIAGTFAMALGTASVTVVVAVLAVGLRSTALAGLGESRAARLAVPVLEIAAGLMVAAIALQLLLRALA